MIIKYLEFPRGNRTYGGGGGGWSRMARHRPLPQLGTHSLKPSDIRVEGKSVWLNIDPMQTETRKLKLNIFTNKGKIVRQDYANIGFKTQTL